MSDARRLDEIPVYPVLRAGHGRTAVDAVAIWLPVAWLMLAEGLAYVEDLEGGAEQPQMRQAAKLRFLEQLADIDNRLAGRTPAGDAHQLALALEYGFGDLAEISGGELLEIFSLGEELGGDACDVSGALAFWARLAAEFPGELPDRLVAQGQRDMLVTMQGWARLARATGLDVGLLTPFMKEA